MEPVDLSDFYSGGYFIIREGNPGWEQLKTDLLPDQFISLSPCFSPRLNINWGWVTGDKKLALDFGIPEVKLDEFIEWCARGYKGEMDMMTMFYSPKAAHRFIDRFSLDVTNLYIIGAGLPRELALGHWLEPTDDLYGIKKRIGQSIEMEQGGIPLGYELVSFSYGDLAHSWLCSGIEREMHQLYNIRPNALGLIHRYEEAKKAYDWIAEDKMKGHRAEPEPYDVWLLVDYPINQPI